MMHKLFLTLLILYSVGCSSIISNKQLGDFKLKESYSQIEQDPRVLHKYVSAELAFKNQDLDYAFKNFKKVSTIADGKILKVEDRLFDLYLLNDDLVYALKTINNILNLDNKPEYYYYLASLLQAQSKSKDALLTLEMGLTEFPKSEFLNLHYLLYSYQKSEDFQRVINIYNQKKSTLDIELSNYFIGRVAEENGNLDLAKKHFRLAIQDKSADSYLIQEITRILIKQKDYAGLDNHITTYKDLNRELKQLDFAIGIKKDYSMLENYSKEKFQLISIEEVKNLISFQIAQKFVSYKDYSNLIKSLLVLLVKTPSYSEARFFLGTAYAIQNRSEESVRQLLKIEKEQNLYLRSRAFAVLVLKRNKEFSRAQAILEEVLEVYPTKQTLIDLYSGILKEQKKYQELKEFLKITTKRLPKNENIRYQYASILFELGSKTQSIKEIKKIIELNPNNGDALNFLAYFYAEKKTNLEESLELIQKAINKDPLNPYYIDTLAFIQLQLGDLDTAEINIKKALKLLPDDPIVLEHHADILDKRGERDKAQQIYLESLKEAKAAEPSIEIEALIKRLRKKIK